MLSKQLALSAGLAISACAVGATPEYIIAISVDGMGSNYAQPLLSQLPTLQKMQTQGAGTFNARTDYGVAITLPSHVGMVTGLPMSSYASPTIDGHGWTTNIDPTSSQTIHQPSTAYQYVPSVFDIAHDNGLSTGLWSGKSKFSLFDKSYNATYGAADVTGADNGRDKLDYSYVVNGVAASTLTTDFLGKLTTSPHNFSFVHYQDPDAAGHSSSDTGWGSTLYNNALIAVDAQIGRILDAIESSPTLDGKTVVILTADHGGQARNHGNTGSLLDTQLPFFVWGAGVTAGDIYAMNSGSLANPGSTIPNYTGLQPIRNGNIANLSLDLLGLQAVPGSFIGVSQNIAVPEPTSLAAIGALSFIALRRSRR